MKCGSAVSASVEVDAEVGSSGADVDGFATSAGVEVERGIGSSSRLGLLAVPA